MKTTRKSHVLKFVSMAILAVFLCAGLASAEEFEGRFTLPVETQWGLVTLHPGDYSFKLNTARPDMVIILQGKVNGGMVLTNGAILREASGGRNELVGFNNGTTLRIRTLRLARIGLTLTYNVPKAERPYLAQGPALFRRVPVVLNGK